MLRHSDRSGQALRNEAIMLSAFNREVIDGLRFFSTHTQTFLSCRVIIFADTQTSRLLYVLRFLCEDRATVPYRVTASAEEFAQYEGPRINYSDAAICSSEIRMVPSGLLSETKHRAWLPDIAVVDDVIVLFPTPNTPPDTYSFDLFSAIFYLLSRYEEYGSRAKDKWGRFPAKESIAYKNQFLHLPVVDIWIQNFFRQLTTHHSSFAVHRKTTVRFTYDIDVAYAYKGRHIVRQGGSAFRDILRINPYNLAQRTAVLAGYFEDPFDTYDYILQESISPVFFLLLSEKKTRYDHNIDPKNRIMKKLAIKLHRKALVGLHPSFYSSDIPKKITVEKKTLEGYTDKKIARSRQHYLRFSVPDTYRHLLHNHIEEDYSMAYAEMPGFRAGTCTPFYFFDVEKDVVTSLKIFPSPIMESTFRDDMIMPVQEALPYFIQYFEEVNKVNGCFIPIFHNDTLAANNKQHFRWLHQQILQYIRGRILVDS